MRRARGHEGRGIRHTLARWGGVLVAPRATLGELSQGPGPAWDGLWLSLLYLATTQLHRVAEGVAAVAAMGNVNGGLVLAQALGRALLPPVLLVFAVEGVLGAPRAHARGALLVPLLLTAALGRGAALAGWGLPGPTFLPELVGAAWALGLALGLRGVVPAAPEPAAAAPEPEEAGSEPEGAVSGVRPARDGGVLTPLVAALVIAVCGAVAGVDAAAVQARWDQMGPLGPGRPIPAFVAHDLGGRRVDETQLQGRVTVLAFWATWCGACSQQMPTLVDLHRRHEGEDFALVGVNIDRDADQRELAASYVAQRALPFAVWLDLGPLSRALRVTLIPHIVVLDRSARLRHVHQGKVSARALEREVQQLLAEPAD